MATSTYIKTTRDLLLLICLVFGAACGGVKGELGQVRIHPDCIGCGNGTRFVAGIDQDFIVTPDWPHTVISADERVAQVLSSDDATTRIRLQTEGTFSLVVRASAGPVLDFAHFSTHRPTGLMVAAKSIAADPPIDVVLDDGPLILKVGETLDLNVLAKTVLRADGSNPEEVRLSGVDPSTDIAVSSDEVLLSRSAFSANAARLTAQGAGSVILTITAFGLSATYDIEVDA